MKEVISKLSSPKAFFYILIIGILLRLVFVFWGGQVYYGKPDYFIQGDTPAWFYSFVNLVETGTYTVNPAVENGKFFRPPGYSFLFGIFYILTFKNYLLAAKLLVLLQVLMDIFNIWLIRQIVLLASREKSGIQKLAFGNAAAALYSVYPFAIVWAPVLYAETSSVFFLLLSIFFSLKPLFYKNPLLSGLAGGLATLSRLQCIFTLPLIFITFLFRKENIKRKVTAMALFATGISITYGLWPARNYFLHNRIVFSQDLNIGNFWSDDYLAFMDYVFSVRTDHNPVYRSLIKGDKVEWPAASYLNPRDSILLDSVSRLCYTCGTGFSYWMFNEGMKQNKILPSENCDSVIAHIFKELTIEQKKNNAFHYWVTVPLGNLQKCFFKSGIYGNKSNSVKLFSTMLFLLRSALIFLGIWGIILAYKNKFFESGFLFFIISYPLIWYIYLSFFYRNIEMRYLLHADILLLIPAAYAVYVFVVNRYQKAI